VRRFLLVGFLAMVAVGCNNAQNSGTGVVTTPPTATPTASPVPTATPVPPKSENYFPVSNAASYGGTQPNGSQTTTNVNPLATAAGVTTCSSTLGSFGDYRVTLGQLVIPTTDINVNPAYGTPLISKNAAGDVYVVGYYNLGTGAETCVSPYPIAKAQMVKGTGWTFVDIAGVSRTAVVVSDHQTASFTVQVAGGATTTYTSIVAQVSYGSDQSIYWAAGYGPVQVINSFTNPGGSIQYPPQLTAFNWTLDPSSK
jgi:hypothetical protein